MKFNRFDVGDTVTWCPSGWSVNKQPALEAKVIRIGLQKVRIVTEDGWRRWVSPKNLKDREADE